MGVNSLPKTVTRQRHGCDLNPGPFAPESSTLTTRLPSHQYVMYDTKFVQKLAFSYRNCPLSLETTKHFQTYINSLLWSGIEIFPKCAVYNIVNGLYWYLHKEQASSPLNIYYCKVIVDNTLIGSRMSSYMYCIYNICRVAQKKTGYWSLPVKTEPNILQVSVATCLM